MTPINILVEIIHHVHKACISMLAESVTYFLTFHSDSSDPLTHLVPLLFPLRRNNGGGYPHGRSIFLFLFHSKMHQKKKI